MSWICDSCNGCAASLEDLYTFDWPAVQLLCLPCVVSSVAHAHAHVHEESADCRVVVHSVGCLQDAGGACAEWLVCRPQVVDCPDPVRAGWEPCGACDECGAGIRCREATNCVECGADAECYATFTDGSGDLCETCCLEDAGGAA